MQASGFVLAGGRSTRMGRDKALLPYRGTTLVQHVACIVQEAAGSVALLGDPDVYGDLGYPVFPDQTLPCGPLGGICCALSVTSTDWNLIVACDMPGISVETLRRLLERAAASGANCVAAAGPGGEPEPLCAVYHRRSFPVLVRALEGKRFRMRDLLPEIGTETVAVTAERLANVNTPGEWGDFEKTQR